MSSQNLTRNITEQILDAREAGRVWVSTKGAKDCVIGVMLIFIAQVLVHIDFDKVINKLWALPTLEIQSIFEQEWVLKDVGLFVCGIGVGLGIITLVIVMIQTRGLCTFKGIRGVDDSPHDSLNIEIFRTACGLLFAFLMTREVLPKACLLVIQSAHKSEFVALFQIVLSRAALFFLVLGITQIVLARAKFLHNLSAVKATD